MHLLHISTALATNGIAKTTVTPAATNTTATGVTAQQVINSVTTPAAMPAATNTTVTGTSAQPATTSGGSQHGIDLGALSLYLGLLAITMLMQL